MFCHFNSQHSETWKSCMLTSCLVIRLELAHALTYIKLDLEKSKFTAVQVQNCLWYVAEWVKWMNIELDCKSRYLSRVDLKASSLKKQIKQKTVSEKESKSKNSEEDMENRMDKCVMEDWRIKKKLLITADQEERRGSKMQMHGVQQGENGCIKNREGRISNVD